MDHVLILETPDHMDNGVHLTNIGQELVAQALSLGGTLDQTRDIDEFNNSRGHLFGVIHLSEKPDPLVRDSDHTYIGIDRAERVISRLSASFCQCVKQGALAYVRKANDS